MSSSALDEQMDIRRSELLAEALGITVDEVDQWVVHDYQEQSDDGLVSGHVVEFADSTPSSILEKVGAGSEMFVNLGPIDFEDRDEEPEDN